MVLVRIPYERLWTATVDGRPARVLPADSVVQAVEVPAGSHSIVLRYQDPWIGRGLAGSALAVGLLAVGAVALRRRAAAGPPLKGAA